MAIAAVLAGAAVIIALAVLFGVLHYHQSIHNREMKKLDQAHEVKTTEFQFITKMVPELAATHLLEETTGTKVKQNGRLPSHYSN